MGLVLAAARLVAAGRVVLRFHPRIVVHAALGSKWWDAPISAAIAGALVGAGLAFLGSLYGSHNAREALKTERRLGAVDRQTGSVAAQLRDELDCLSAVLTAEWAASAAESLPLGSGTDAVAAQLGLLVSSQTAVAGCGREMLLNQWGSFVTAGARYGASETAERSELAAEVVAAASQVSTTAAIYAAELQTNVAGLRERLTTLGNEADAFAHQD
ncbi:MAG: hypothetical protein ACLPQS_01065 [Acidimicrobiales bacterium]